MDGDDMGGVEFNEKMLFDIKKLTRQQMAALGKRMASLESQLASKGAAAKMDTHPRQKKCGEDYHSALVATG